MFYLNIKYKWKQKNKKIMVPIMEITATKIIINAGGTKYILISYYCLHFYLFHLHKISFLLSKFPPLKALRLKTL